MAYKITIQSDNGRTVYINAGTGLDGNMDPISGVDVKISASQSANQIGESITDQTVGSVVRTISGECRTPAAAKELLRAVPPLSKGKLILNDAYSCEYVVKRSPYVTREKGSRNKRTFSTILYCQLPYWQSITPSSCLIGGYTPSFHFPVTYAKPHRFGTRSPFAFVNVLNLNGTFLSLLESNVKNAIKQVKIPYCTSGSTTDIKTGANGLSAKVFLPALREVGVDKVDIWDEGLADGAKLSFFTKGNKAGKEKRIAMKDGAAAEWWLRTPYYSFQPGGVYRTAADGLVASGDSSATLGVRPCIILPQDALVDDTGHVIA